MKTRILQAGAASLVLLMLAANAASADQSQGDNDTSTPGVQNSYTLSVQSGASVQLTAQIAVNHQGSKHLAAGQTVVFGIATGQATLPAGYTADDISVAIPAGWSSGTVTGSGQVSFTAPASAGSYSYVFKYDPKSYTCASSPCLSGQNAFTVDLTVEQAQQPPEPEPEPQADPVAPTITINQPLDGAVLVIGDELAADYSCQSDSAMVECAGPVADGAPVDTSSVGWNTFSVHAVDADGDETTESVSYRVVYPFAFINPLLETPGLNSPLTAGSRVKIRFTMFGYHGGAVLHGWPRHQEIDCNTGEASGRPTVRRVRKLRYNPSTDQYSFLWVTKASWAGTCRRFFVRLEDEMHHTANFSFVVSFGVSKQD